LGRLDGRRAPLLPHPVAAQVQGNAIQPRRELRLALEAGERPVGAQECVLNDVTRLLLPADRAVGESIDRPFPAQDELVEAVDVSVDGPSDELLVGPRCPDQAQLLPGIWAGLPLRKTARTGFQSGVHVARPSPL